MIELIRLVLPYLLALFYVVKGTKEPLYFLGIPFLMFMSDSIFFEGAKLFHNPGSIDYALMFIWLLGLWIISNSIHKHNGKNEIIKVKSLDFPDYCIIGLMLISFAGYIITSINYIDITNVFTEFFRQMSMFAGYFIIKNWTSQNKPEVLVKFLLSIVVINSIASLLYILHQGLHFNIYEDTATGVVDIFQGNEIVRHFYFMPQFLFFSIAFILVFKGKKIFYSAVLLSINLMAIFISYTRSFLIIAVVLFVFYFIITGLKKGKLQLVLKNVFIFVLAGILGFFILSKFLPTGTQFFMERFSEITQSKSSTGEPNDIEFRFANTENIISKMDQNKKILGMGSVTESQLPIVTDMNGVTADMVWPGVIFRWGFVGLILFILLYIFSFITAFNFYMKSEGVLSDLALLFLLYIIAQSIESFVSWTFLSGHGFTIGLWYFAMLSAVVGFNKMHRLSNKEIVPNE